MLALALGIQPARAETWRTTNGPALEGQLSGVYGAVAIISGKAGAGLIPLGRMDDEGLARVADYLVGSAKAPPTTWAASTGTVAKSLRHKLQVLRDGKLVDFDPGTRPEPKLYLVYFGAHWCPPCRRFSPGLVEAYNRMKERTPDAFELVFVSNDHSQDEQLTYARDLAMPWPIVKFNSVGSVDPVERWEGPGIPDLVVLTRNGEALCNSYHGDEYVGPQSVLDEAEPLLNAMDPDTPACRRERHRLSVLQYIRASPGATKGPKPYMVGLDRSRYQTLETKALTAVLEIDERGCVTDAKIEPELPAVIEFQLEQDAKEWLFLPAVSNGHAKPIRAKLPISF